MSTNGDGAAGVWTVFRGDALDAYADWPTPAVIVSDGAYGVGGFPGDPRTPGGLAEWYEPHIEAWSQHARPATTLWFWNTEVGWATVHPLLADHGWTYVQSIVWDKGLGHIAGNVNGETIRRFPVVTELCVLYRRRLEFSTPDGVLRKPLAGIPARDWIEFLRRYADDSDLNAIWQDLHGRVRRRLDRDVETRSADAMQSLGRVVDILGGAE